MVNAFGESECVGEVRGDFVYFDNIVNGENGCNVGTAKKLDINGVLHELWQFSTGFEIVCSLYLNWPIRLLKFVI